jgi:hypothetical protein
VLKCAEIGAKFGTNSPVIGPRAEVRLPRWHHTSVASSQFPGLPGWTRATCLGCAGLVKATRDAHVLVGGRRDGTALFAIGVEPQNVLAEEPEAVMSEPLLLFGVAHRGCLAQARERLRSGQVDLPAELPLMSADEIEELPEEYHHPPTGKFCPFCGSDEALTVEHVWPQWMSRALRKHVGAKQHERPFAVSVAGAKRVSRAIDVEAPACALCNNHWLSVLEQDVRPVLEPMLLGEGRILSRTHQLLLATWAVKTVLMFDAATGADAVIPMGYYREFAQLRAPLPSTQVWLGAYSGIRPGLAWRQALWVDVPSEEAPNAFVTTFTAYRVVFQVAGHFVRDASFRDRRYQFASGVHRIWPVEPGSIRWPSRKFIFGDGSLEVFAGSFSDGQPQNEEARS